MNSLISLYLVFANTRNKIIEINNNKIFDVFLNGILNIIIKQGYDQQIKAFLDLLKDSNFSSSIINANELLLNSSAFFK